MRMRVFRATMSPVALSAMVLVAALAPRGAAQSGAAQSAAAPAGVVSTSSGIYTTSQADRGEKAFSNYCTGCHATSNYTESGFRASWNGRPLSELFLLISETMPEDFPGGLSPTEYAELLAYLLRLNRAPAGDTDLPADAKALEKIRIDIGSTSGGGGS
jgi:mono/diheme cytochrome c family protein